MTQKDPTSKQERHRPWRHGSYTLSPPLLGPCVKTRHSVSTNSGISRVDSRRFDPSKFRTEIGKDRPP